MDRALSGATTPSQSGPGSNDNEGVLRIPQGLSITGTSPYLLNPSARVGYDTRSIF